MRYGAAATLVRPRQTLGGEAGKAYKPAADGQLPGIDAERARARRHRRMNKSFCSLRMIFAVTAAVAIFGLGALFGRAGADGRWEKPRLIGGRHHALSPEARSTVKGGDVVELVAGCKGNDITVRLAGGEDSAVRGVSSANHTSIGSSEWTTMTAIGGAKLRVRADLSGTGTDMAGCQDGLAVSRQVSELVWWALGHSKGMHFIDLGSGAGCVGIIPAIAGHTSYMLASNVKGAGMLCETLTINANELMGDARLFLVPDFLADPHGATLDDLVQGLGIPDKALISIKVDVPIDGAVWNALEGASSLTSQSNVVAIFVHFSGLAAAEMAQVEDDSSFEDEPLVDRCACLRHLLGHGFLMFACEDDSIEGSEDIGDDELPSCKWMGNFDRDDEVCNDFAGGLEGWMVFVRPAFAHIVGAAPEAASADEDVSNAKNTDEEANIEEGSQPLAAAGPPASIAPGLVDPHSLSKAAVGGKKTGCVDGMSCLTTSKWTCIERCNCAWVESIATCSSSSAVGELGGKQGVDHGDERAISGASPCIVMKSTTPCSTRNEWACKERCGCEWDVPVGATRGRCQAAPVAGDENVIEDDVDGLLPITDQPENDSAKEDDVLNDCQNKDSDCAKLVNQESCGKNPCCEWFSGLGFCDLADEFVQ